MCHSITVSGQNVYSYSQLFIENSKISTMSNAYPQLVHVAWIPDEKLNDTMGNCFINRPNKWQTYNQNTLNIELQLSY